MLVRHVWLSLYVLNNQIYPTMKIEKLKVVSVTYDLRTDGFEGQIVESATEENPLKFIFGIGMMLPAFEAQLEGLEQGDTFQFKLSADDAYGQPNPENILDIPIQAFDVDGKRQNDLLQVGNVIPMQDNEGNQFYGEIKEIGEDTVKMDFNHPMAGKDLYFIGKVIEVRDATPEELDHGHVH